VPPLYRLLILVLGHLGPRLGEALALRWSDLKADEQANRRTVSFFRTLKRGKEQSAVEGETKTERSRRTLGVSKDLWAEFELHKALTAHIPGTLVFATEKGTYLNPSNLRNRILLPAVSEALILKQLDPKELSGLLAHVPEEYRLQAKLLALPGRLGCAQLLEARWAQWDAGDRTLSYLDYAGEDRLLLVPESLASELEAHRRGQSEEGRPNKRGLIFPGPGRRSAPIRRQDFIDAVYRHAIGTFFAGEPRISPHHFRRSYASADHRCRRQRQAAQWGNRSFQGDLHDGVVCT
jgi:integrase